MSMFNKLKAIRTRVEANPEENKEETASTNEEAGEDSVIHAASMWDLVADTVADTDDGASEQTEATAEVQQVVEEPAPTPEEVAPETKAVAESAEPFSEPPQAAEPKTAAKESAVVTAIPVAKQPEPEVAPVEAPKDKPRRSGRVKTRLIGFDKSNGDMVDIADFDKKEEKPAAKGPLFPVGWLVIISGPGRGETFNLSSGVSQIGREEGQAIQLDFGDNSISRSNHASVAFDDEQQSFYIGHGGKSNLVRLNGKPLLSTEALKNGDEIRIGETTLRLVALCGEDFNWADKPEST